MKLIIVIMTAFLVQASAATFAQQVTLKDKSIALKEVFAQLRKQTGYVVLYRSAVINKARPISIDIERMPLEQALKTILKDQNLDFEIKQKSIIITEKEPSFLERIIDRFQAIEVRGKVVDGAGRPLSGASVKAKGTGRTVTTNDKGEFSMSGVDEKEVLVISYVGFEPREVAAKADLGNVVLSASLSKLDEVQVIAYGTTTKRLNTGSVSSIKGDEISKQPVSNLLGALSAKVPGLYIRQVVGVPGSNYVVRLRGENSIANGNEPLYVVDGVPYYSNTLGNGGISTQSVLPTPGNPLGYLDVNNIESIDILKDADATAIYGSRGANGVILITTKKGRLGKTKVEFNVYQGIGEVANKLKLLNTPQYLEMRREAFQNDAAVVTLARAPDLLNWDTTRYTDWQKLLIGNIARNTSAQFNVSGGSDKTQFLIGGSYFKETTVYPGDFNNKKLNGHMNLNHSSEDQRFNISTGINFQVDNNLLPGNDLTFAAITLPPNSPSILDANGGLNWQNSTWTNPYSYLEKKYETNASNLIINSSIDYLIFKGLHFKTNLGFINTGFKEVATLPTRAIIPNDLVAKPTASFGNTRVWSWLTEPQLSYKTRLYSGVLEVLLGATLQQQITEKSTITETGFASDDLLESIAAGATVTDKRASYINYKYGAIFGRINYNYKDKYLMNITARRDGSSRFGPGRQFANFGAIGAGWLFSKEKFISENFGLLSYGKLRSSYGITGNDQTTDYGFLSTYTSGVVYQAPTLVPVQLFNEDYRWEVNKKFEIALEMGFFKDRLMLSAGYYKNRSSNQLLGYPLAPTTGFSTIQMNLPAIIQNKGLEFEVTSQNFKGRDFNWSTSLNISFPKNTLVSYPDISNSSYSNQYIVGESILISRNINYLGVDPQSGVYVYEKSNGTSSNSPSFPSDLTTFTETSQKYFGGIKNTFNYRNWQIDFTVQFVDQLGSEYLKSFQYPGNRINQLSIVMNRWQYPGDVSQIQKFSQASGAAATAYGIANNYGNNGYTDASFMRLKNLALSYILPTSFKKVLSIDNCRLFLQAQNLFTITEYMGLDPETRASGTLPPLRVITAGIHLTL